jgi:hypothetical protein
VLRAFLFATQAGLTSLSWQVNCPVCRVGAASTDSLGALGGTSHCGACEIDYEVDFAQHVEAVFPIHEAVSPRDARALLRLEPGVSAARARAAAFPGGCDG